MTAQLQDTSLQGHDDKAKLEAPTTGVGTQQRSVTPGIRRITAVKYSFTVKEVWKRTQTLSQVSPHSKRITSKENIQQDSDSKPQTIPLPQLEWPSGTQLKHEET